MDAVHHYYNQEAGLGVISSGPTDTLGRSHSFENKQTAEQTQGISTNERSTHDIYNDMQVKQCYPCVK